MAELGIPLQLGIEHAGEQFDDGDELLPRLKFVRTEPAHIIHEK
jgi:hypothetical protein